MATDHQEPIGREPDRLHIGPPHPQYCGVARLDHHEPRQLPLFVDLDGTLIGTDTTLLCLLAMIDRPLRLGAALCALLRGRAAMKRALAAAAPDPALLPYHEAFLARLREEAASGRTLILATGADHQIAAAVADHLGLFDAVLASDGRTNLVGAAKLAAIRRMIGSGAFSYAGNEKKDLAIWREAESAILVGVRPRLRRAVAATTRIERAFPSQVAWPRALAATFRRGCGKSGAPMPGAGEGVGNCRYWRG
jgi:hypothetical protein